MTNDELRALDRRVLEALGWTEKPDIFSRLYWSTPDDRLCYQLPFVSICPTACFAHVVAAMEARGYRWKASSLSEGVEAVFWADPWIVGRCGEGVGGKIAEALCRAAVAALELEKGANDGVG